MSTLAGAPGIWEYLPYSVADSEQAAQEEFNWYMTHHIMHSMEFTVRGVAYQIPVVRPYNNCGT